jgi:serine/threonine protein kinase/formylglycine-generating enzyme required for sulfatase activity
MDERSIFLAALDIDDPAERAAYVARACANDAILRGQVEGLLKAHGEPCGFMGRPAPALVETIDDPSAREGPGAVIGPYKLLEQIGEGGFGFVYMAEQQRPVRRKVALKVLKPGMDTRQVVARFEAERQALALMDHPNIAHIFDGGETTSGRPYFVMELVRGVPITEFCDQNHLSVRDRLDLFVAVCRAVHHAHQKGVIHRDVKPSNVLVTLHDGVPVAKVIDFGVAKAMGQQLTERTLFTNFAQMVGTPLYMSPEQAEMSGLDVDTRADVYALGVLLYELLTGTTPFDKKRFKTAGYDEIRRIIREEEPVRPSNRISTMGQAAATVSANRKSDPHSLRRLCRGELDWVVMKCLEKDRNRRYDTAAALADDVKRFLADEPVLACPPSASYRLRKFVRRNKRALVAAAVILSLAAASAFGVYQYRMAQAKLSAERQRAEDERWMREEAIPAIRLYISEKNYPAAFDLVAEAERRVPGDPTLAELSPEFSGIWSAISDPPQAEAYWRPYGVVEADWKPLGRTPLDKIRLPRGFIHWKLAKDGYATVEGCRAPEEGTASFTLAKSEAVPTDMVRVDGNRYRAKISGFEFLDKLQVEDYFIDRYEVTNRQFKEFVDHGGYQKREYWKHDFRRGSEKLSWETTMKEFRDATGSPGPATWSDGTYPPGEDDHPVHGVSWYEAAAYGEFAGKSLPTVTHWCRASGAIDKSHIAAIAAASNFRSTGLAPVGRYPSVGPFGTYDMAGNVKEWCWNESGGDKRCILGGCWEEPVYMFSEPYEAPALARSPQHGFRCAKYPSGRVPEAAFAPHILQSRDYRTEKPLPEDVVRGYKAMYVYDKSPLNAKVLTREETPDYVHETIHFDAAYGDERVIAHLYLPRNTSPPYQTIIFFPPTSAALMSSFPKNGPVWASPHSTARGDLGFLLQSGRAVLWPIYKGTYERRFEHRPGWSFIRDQKIQIGKDFQRSLDYLESRKEIDATKIAYQGNSWGTYQGLPLLAIDPRPKAAVFVNACLTTEKVPMPELDGVNYAPLVKIPILLIGGGADASNPVEINQRPLFQFLGTPEHHKKHVIAENAGHYNLPWDVVTRETLAWLDKYLGPVARPGGP